MNQKKVIVLFSAALLAVVTQAETVISNGIDRITHGSTTIEMKFIPIGYLNNPVDPDTVYGAVDHPYRIGKFEVSGAQWSMVNGADNRLKTPRASGNTPEHTKNWFDVAQFANWLTSGNIYQGAYQFNDSGQFQGIDREAAKLKYDPVYVLPTENEWYKAAYFRPAETNYTVYPTGNSAPRNNRVTGSPDPRVEAVYNIATLGGIPKGGISSGDESLSPVYVNYKTAIMENNGTYHMGGNVQEWLENNVIRGGSYADDSANNLRKNIRVAISRTSTGGDFRGVRLAALDGISELPERPTISLTILEEGKLVRWLEGELSNLSSYYVQYNEDISSNNWNMLINSSFGESPSSTYYKIIDFDDAGARFYRVLAGRIADPLGRSPIRVGTQRFSYTPKGSSALEKVYTNSNNNLEFIFKVNADGTYGLDYRTNGVERITALPSTYRSSLMKVIQKTANIMEMSTL